MKDELPRGVFPVHNRRTGEVMSYRVRWRTYDGEGEASQHSENFSTLEEAADYRADLDFMRRHGQRPATRRRRLPDEQEMTFSDLAVEWTIQHAYKRLAPKTVKTYTPIVDRLILPELGDYKLRELVSDPGIFVRYQQRLEEHYGLAQHPQQLIKTLRLVLGILRRGRRWHPELIPTVPAEGMFEFPSASRQKLTRPLPPAVIERLRAQLLKRRARDPLLPLRDATILSLSAYVVAFRPQELLALTWDRLANRTFAVEEKLTVAGIEPGTKTGKVRFTWAWQTALDDLDAWRLAWSERYGEPDANALIFPADGGGAWTTSAQNNWAKRQWKDARAAVAQEKDLGWVAQARWYDARGSAISLALRAQMDLQQVADRAGTTVANLEARYARTLVEMQGTDRVDPDQAIAEARAAVPLCSHQRPTPSAGAA